MALTPDETAVFNDLSEPMGTSELADRRVDAYYEGAQRLEHIGLAVPPELRRFETVVNWPRLSVDAVEERLDVEGFRLPGSDEPGEAQNAADELWRIWQANNLDEESQMAHIDALVYGRAFACVGANEDDPATPLVTVETPRQLNASIDDRTRRVNAALRLYGATDLDPTPKLATLYLPDVTVWLQKGSDGRFEEYDRDPHRLGVVPVVPLLNRRRTGRWGGVSELTDIIPLTDAAARSLTNLQIAGETHSVPQKYVLGMSKGDFVDADGNPIPAWQAYFSAIWANAKSPREIGVGQFTASSLSNFHETVNHYAAIVASLTGLPMRYLGQNTANPPSADAIRADESRLVKRAERKQRVFGGSWEQVMRLCQRFADLEVSSAAGMETIWRDPSTPTIAAKTDAIVKLASGDKPILSREGAWDELGWSKARKDRERAYFEQQAADPLLSQALQSVTSPQTAPSAPVSPTA